jgi:hypothetical protein
LVIGATPLQGTTYLYVCAALSHLSCHRAASKAIDSSAQSNRQGLFVVFPRNDASLLLAAKQLFSCTPFTLLQRGLATVRAFCKRNQQKTNQRRCGSEILQT